MTVARRIAVEIVAAFGPFGRRIGPEHVEEIAARVAKHMGDDVLGELRAVAPWPGAVDVLARRHGVIARVCMDCGQVYAVRDGHGEFGASHGLDPSCARKRELTDA